MENDAKRNHEDILSEENTDSSEQPSSHEKDMAFTESDNIDEDIQSDEEEKRENDESDDMQELERKLADATNRMLRIQADYDNFRRRTKQEKESAAKYRSQSLAEKLLPALDNFERGMMITPQEEETKSLLQGMEMVYRQLKDALAEEGIEPIETVGKPFDPHYHQAVMQVETDEFESNVVVEEMQKGYQLKDKVIRPAMVKVNA
ncbi:nucleotide exchange factor GrpE [Salipaludibacillus agaradhaerens]|uniref:nucleotide exchange factor GrpE n=1 Tax=Salipaludibacillus agaradhaerens TaxID=76935 RepID=UPI002151BF40|nr:nucleotide exchange factor GrpE [Salipaludibacillus agaradhaerens]MCR6106299.1 nucleotide exchange factor GrpE [Salipaludibacillus agaradhaerens]MCR6118332.1 nucleotide exchange factor GrpE [Salipaludibacillus agaradhaerens]UJW57440.1 nucleotide exchange factor GrpE [Bacillus sp. A116_S68]